MSDLISRDAAIDALKDVSEHYTDKGREWHPHVDFMVEAIQDLPSAQPEIIMCKDCRWHEEEQPGMVYCPRIVGNWVEDDWYCKDGERRGEEDE